MDSTAESDGHFNSR